MNIKKLILEAAQEIEQEIADGTLKIGEAKSFKVNPKYTHFAVDKATGKIITGWEYKDLDPESIRSYVKMDLKDMELKPSDVEIKTTKTLKSKGIDPFNWSSWNSANNPPNEATVVISTPTGDTPTDPLKKKQAADELKKGNTVKYQKVGAPLEEVGLAEVETTKEYEVVYVLTGKIVAGPFKDIKRARMARDKKDLERGGYGHVVRVKGAAKPGLAEAAGQDLLLYLAELLIATPMSVWSGFSWAKGVLAIPHFKADVEAAKSKKDKIEVVKNALSHVMNPADVGSYKDSLKEAADEPTDAEQEAPAEEQGNISDKLSELISQAIDAAGQVISSTEDKKLETALGKVLKNLTASQDALAKVSEHEGKLAEKAEVEHSKNLEKYTKDFLKGLRKYTKDDALINKFKRTYDPLVAAAMKAGKPVDEIVKTSWGHFTLNESKK